MYLRFVSCETDPDSHISQGLFQAASRLRDRGLLEEYERLWTPVVVGWFERELKVPARTNIRLRYDSHEH